MDKQNTDFGFVMFMTGLVIGAVVAILYAPKSGKETRDNIRQKKDRVQEGMKNVKDEAKSTAKQGAHNIKESVKAEMQQDEDRYR